MNRPDLHNVAKWAPAIVCCLLAGIILGGYAWYAGQTRAIVEATRETQVSNTKTSQQTNANTLRLKRLLHQVIEGNARIKDCTEPGGECFQRSQENQAKVLDLLTLRFIFVAVCRPDHPIPSDVTQVDQCVNRLMKAATVTLSSSRTTTAQGQAQDREATLAALDQAVEDALALDVDENYDRILAAKAAGICRAVQIREPKWTGFKNASDHLLVWTHNHPPRQP